MCMYMSKHSYRLLWQFQYGKWTVFDFTASPDWCTMPKNNNTKVMHVVKIFLSITFRSSFVWSIVKIYFFASDLISSLPHPVECAPSSVFISEKGEGSPWHRRWWGVDNVRGQRLPGQVSDDPNYSGSLSPPLPPTPTNSIPTPTVGCLPLPSGYFRKAVVIGLGSGWSTHRHSSPSGYLFVKPPHRLRGLVNPIRALSRHLIDTENYMCDQRQLSFFSFFSPQTHKIRELCKCYFGDK